MRSIADGGNASSLSLSLSGCYAFSMQIVYLKKGILRSTVLAILASKRQGDYLNTTTRERPLKPEEFV